MADESPLLGGVVGRRERSLNEPHPAQRADAFDMSHHPRADRHQRHRLVLHQRRPARLQDEPLSQPGRQRIDRVLPRSGSGGDRNWAAPAHEHFDIAAFVDPARRPVYVIQPDLDACHKSVRAPHRPAHPVPSALLPPLALQVVGAKVKLHGLALDKLRQSDFVASAASVKAEYP